jgi:hypothetical protein
MIERPIVSIQERQQQRILEEKQSLKKEQHTPKVQRHRLEDEDPSTQAVAA